MQLEINYITIKRKHVGVQGWHFAIESISIKERNAGAAIRCWAFSVRGMDVLTILLLISV